MKLMMIVLLYVVCVVLIRSVLLKLFGGRNPSEKLIQVITLLAIFWPIGPEIAVLGFFYLVVKAFVAFCHQNQKLPENRT